MRRRRSVLPALPLGPGHPLALRPGRSGPYAAPALLPGHIREIAFGAVEPAIDEQHRRIAGSNQDPPTPLSLPRAKQSRFLATGQTNWSVMDTFICRGYRDFPWSRLREEDDAFCRCCLARSTFLACQRAAFRVASAGWTASLAASKWPRTRSNTRRSSSPSEHGMRIRRFRATEVSA